MSMKHLAALTLCLAAASASSAQTWEQVASFPGVGRHHPVTFALNGFGYLVTGSTTGGSTISDDFFRYDPVADSWTVLPDFPGPDRTYSYGGSYGGKGYLGFGSGSVFLADLWEYNPQTALWTQLAPLPALGRTHPAFVITDDGKIFVGCGGAQTGNLKDWWEYDIATNVWVQRPDLPGPTRHHPYYFNIGNTPYVCFGHGAGIYKDVYRYNRGNNTWTRMLDLPAEGRVAGTQFSRGGKGYVLSGEDEAHDQFPTGEMWEYDGVLDSWTQLTPHPGEARWAPGTFLIDETLYFTGGLMNSGLRSDMWKYSFLDPADVATPIGQRDDLFVVFPNPVRGQSVRIVELAQNASSPSQVRLLNAEGRQIVGLTSTGGAVEIPQALAAGRYFLSFAAQDGTTHTRPITVVR